MSAQDRTEKPTPKRLRDARREGRVARVPDIGGWTAMLVASALIPSAARHLALLFNRMFGQVPTLIEHPDAGQAVALLRTGVHGGMLTLAPLVATMMATGIVASVAQGGLRVAPKRFKPDMSRLNPIKGLRRMLGKEGAWAAVKSLLKVAAPTLVAYSQVRALVDTVSRSVAPLSVVVELVASAALAMVRAVAVVALGLAIVEYAVERRRLAKSLRMTRQQVKDENRQTEGSPHMKSAIRSRQLAMSRNRMISDVSTADVVVVNPTHVAVAIRYEPGRGAPLVVAKGADTMATRIREEANKHRIPMVEDVPLARALFRVCDLGTEIPAELYDAVARVLAFIFSLRRRGVAGTSGVVRPPSQTNIPAEVLTSRRRLPTRRRARTATT